MASKEEKQDPTKVCMFCGGGMTPAPEFGPRWYKCLNCTGTYDTPYKFQDSIVVTATDHGSVGKAGTPHSVKGPGKLSGAGIATKKNNLKQLKF